MLPVEQEKLIYHAVLNNIDYLNNCKPEFFDLPNYPLLFKMAKKFTIRYSNPPTADQLKNIVKINNIEGITDDFIDILYDIDLNLYDAEWLNNVLHAWIEIKTLNKSAEALYSYLKTTQITIENAHNVFENALDIFNKGVNITLDDNIGLDFFNTNSHIQIKANTFPTGYKYLDIVLGGGWSLKNFYVFAGETKIGKSIWLSNIAVNAIKNGNNCIYISFEMQDRYVIKRLGSNLLNIPISEYNDISNDVDYMKKKIELLNANSMDIMGKLWVKEFPTSSASVKDIERYVIKLEDKLGIKFKVVIVDYINIVSNWRNPNSENTYFKIKQIAEDLRAMGVRNNWAVITATQVNRSGYGAKGELSLTNIAESSGLGHTVDWMGGIMQDILMYTNKEYMLQTMLNRNEGYKNSKKKFKVNYDYMRIIEDELSDIIIE